MTKLIYALVTSLVAVAPAIPAMSATLVVGSCRPNQQSYSTIQAAVNAAATARGRVTVLVCPGTYAEQVTITTPLTLKGISMPPLNNPTITPPTGGLTVGSIQPRYSPFDGAIIAVDTFGAPGTVDIEGIEVNGGPSCDADVNRWVTGILYLSTSGTINSALFHAVGDGGCGSTAILGENDDGRPMTLAASNNAIWGGYPAADGIVAFTGPSASTLDFKIKDNLISLVNRPAILETNGPDVSFSGNVVETLGELGGIEVYDASEIRDNLIKVHSYSWGMAIVNSGARIIGNTFNIDSTVGTGLLISSNSAATVKSNKFVGPLHEYPPSLGTGIRTWSTAATIQSNIMLHLEKGIDFGCSRASVGVNTIVESDVGISNVPSGMSISGTFLKVPATTTFCQ